MAVTLASIVATAKFLLDVYTSYHKLTVCQIEVRYWLRRKEPHEPYGFVTEFYLNRYFTVVKLETVKGFEPLPSALRGRCSGFRQQVFD